MPNLKPDGHLVKCPDFSIQRDRPIVFFDGECVMCNRFVDILLQLDPDGAIAIAPLQGQTAQQMLPPFPENREAWSLYYYDETGLYCQSEATLRICQRLGGWWSFLASLLIIPPIIRDGVYRLIAHNRYHIMGRYSTCRLPSAKDWDRFLP